MPTDTKFTALMLFQGTLFFALMDALYAPLFMWRAYKSKFHGRRWLFVTITGLIGFGFFAWPFRKFWEMVSHYT